MMRADEASLRRACCRARCLIFLPPAFLPGISADKPVSSAEVTAYMYHYFSQPPRHGTAKGFKQSELADIQLYFISRAPHARAEAPRWLPMR